MILCRDTRLLLVFLYRNCDLSSSELHLVRVLLLLLFLLLGFVGSLVLVSDLFGLGFVYFLGYLCFTHCASLYVDFVFVVRDGCKKDCFIFPG